jgi:hypothetical protein
MPTNADMFFTVVLTGFMPDPMPTNAAVAAVTVPVILAQCADAFNPGALITKLAPWAGHTVDAGAFVFANVYQNPPNSFELFPSSMVSNFCPTQYVGVAVGGFAG